MAHKLIKTYNYLLALDDSHTILCGDWIFSTSKSFGPILFNGETDYENTIVRLYWSRVIAHLPLNDSPILEGVDLLPPIEDDVEQMAQAYFEAKGHNLYNHYNTMPSFKEGYNKAREKYKYTEEDMRRAIEMSKDIKYVTFSIDEIIQSISQYPTEFECEMKQRFEPDKDKRDNPANGVYYEPKTTTNAQGQRVWVGKYK